MIRTSAVSSLISGISVKGVYLVTRALIPALLRSPTRTVLTVGSAAGHMLETGLSAYETSKFAIGRFGEFVAKDYEGEGLVAITVHPGSVPTDLVFFVSEEKRGLYFQDTPRLAGDTLVWLARERRDWLSGRFVVATWDMQELEGMREEIMKRDLLKYRLTV